MKSASSRFFYSIILLIDCLCTFSWAGGPDLDLKLVEAVKDGNFELVSTVLNDGANPNARDSGGSPVIVVAAAAGKAEIVKLLIGKKVDVNAKTTSGVTALMATAFTGDKETAQMLIANGADPFAVNNDGNSALDFAKRKNKRELIALLQNRPSEHSVFARLPLVERDRGSWEAPYRGKVKSKDESFDVNISFVKTEQASGQYEKTFHYFISMDFTSSIGNTFYYCGFKLMDLQERNSTVFSNTPDNCTTSSSHERPYYTKSACPQSVLIELSKDARQARIVDLKAPFSSSYCPGSLTDVKTKLNESALKYWRQQAQ